MTDCLLVMTTLPDLENARQLAGRLLQQKLAACISVLPPATSFYVWEGRVHEETEQLLLIKTHQQHYDRLEAVIRAEHPYELPEIIATGIVRGLPDYLRWIEESTQE